MFEERYIRAKAGGSYANPGWCKRRDYTRLTGPRALLLGPAQPGSTRRLRHCLSIYLFIYLERERGNREDGEGRARGAGGGEVGGAFNPIIQGTEECIAGLCDTNPN